MNIIETLYFDSYSELGSEISDRFYGMNIHTCDIAIFAKYEEAKAIIESLIRVGHDIMDIGVHPGTSTKYKDEYLISLTDEGIWCQEFKDGDRYLDDDATVSFVSNDCSSVCLSHIHSNEVYAFEVGYCDDLEDEYDYDDEDDWESMCLNDLYEETEMFFNDLYEETEMEKECDSHDECSPDCSWYDECKGEECKVNESMDDDNDLEVTHVSRDNDGNILGITKSWVDSSEGSTRYSSFSIYSSDVDDMKECAKELGVEL